MTTNNTDTARAATMAQQLRELDAAADQAHIARKGMNEAAHDIYAFARNNALAIASTLDALVAENARLVARLQEVHDKWLAMQQFEDEEPGMGDPDNWRCWRKELAAKRNQFYDLITNLGTDKTPLAQIVTMGNEPSIAQLAFEAYSAERGNTAYDGSPIPEWDSAKPEIKNAWVTASATAVKAYINERGGKNRIDINTYAAQVRELRRRNDLSQDELAQKAGLSRTYISLIERGQATNITVGALRRIFTALEQELPDQYLETGSSKWEGQCSALREENVKLREALVDMVNQHCTDHTGLMSTGALSANEDAINLLEAMGLIKQVSERPRRYRWVKQEPAS